MVGLLVGVVHSVLLWAPPLMLLLLSKFLKCAKLSGMFL